MQADAVGRHRTPRRPLAFDDTDAPALADVVRAGIGEEVHVPGGVLAVRVEVAPGSRHVFLLTRAEYQQWRNNRRPVATRATRRQ